MQRHAVHENEIARMPSPRPSTNGSSLRSSVRLPRGRGWVTVPVAVALAALASSTPVVVAAVMVVVVLPMPATLGDMVAHRYRSDVGAAVRAWHRADARTVAPVFYVRNLLAGLLRSAPGLALGAVAVVVAAAVGDPHVDSGWRDLVVRLGGVGTVLCLLLPARSGGRRFRTGTGIDHLVADLVDVRGHLRPHGWVVAIVSVARSAALGLWLHPELWPLRV